MKVFVAGATGALGKQLVPMLVANGHHVVGMTRTEAKPTTSLGAQPVVADALDADAGACVGEAEPDVIVHQLTAIPPSINMRRFDREFALTNRLRTEGTDHLLSAGQAAGVKRFVAQSNAAVPPAPVARSSGRTTRSTTIPVGVPPGAGGDPSPGGGGHGRSLERRHRAALRLVLRPRHLDRPRPTRQPDRAAPQAPAPHRRRGHGHLVFRPHRGRRHRRPSPPSRADLPASTTSSTTNRHPCPSSSRCWQPPSVRSGRCGCRAGSGAWRQARWPSWP